MTDTGNLMLLLVEGQDVGPEFQRLLLTLSVNLKEKKADAGTMVLNDPDSTLFDSKIFRKGREIAFIIGPLNDLSSEGPFVVKSNYPNYPESGDITLTVSFQDKSHKMNKKQKQKRWKGTVDGVVKKIARSHGLGYDIDSVGDVIFDDDFPLIQANTTDAAFLRMLSIRYGYVWGVSGDNLYFKKQTTDLDEGSQTEDGLPVLQYGGGTKSLVSFAPKLKFSKRGVKKFAAKKTGSIDLLSDSVGDAVEDIGGFLKSMGMDPAKIGVDTGEVANDVKDMVKRATHQEMDDDAENQATAEGEGRPSQKVIVDSTTGTLSRLPMFNIPNPNVVAGINKDEPNEHTGPGDPSGAASPTKRAEALRRLAAAKIGSTVVVEGTAVPRRASFRYRPRSVVVLDGIADRLKGKYKITESTITYDKEEGLHQSLSVEKRNFYPDEAAIRQMAKKIMDETSTKGSDSEQPQKLAGAASKKTIRVDSVRGTFSSGTDTFKASLAKGVAESITKSLVDGRPDTGN